MREGGLEERWRLRAGDGGSVGGGEFREREGLRLGSVTPGTTGGAPLRRPWVSPAQIRAAIP